VSFFLQFSALPRFLKIAYTFAVLFIILHFFILSAFLYWQFVEPDTLTFKAWFKAPMHLDSFDSFTMAAVFFVGFMILQLIGLFLFSSWVFKQNKKIYYLVVIMVVIGIWTYFLIPALIILILMLPEKSLHHFGLLSFEDLF
jgi:hypothetical protein